MRSSQGEIPDRVSATHTMLASLPILTGGTEEQKAEYLGRVTAGKLAKDIALPSLMLDLMFKH